VNTEKSTRSVLAILFLLCSPIAFGEYLGSTGQTYALDRDGREQMKDVVRRKQGSGELDAYWRNYRDKMEAAIKNPAPLGIKIDYNSRSELHNLRFTLPQDYLNENGQVVARRGTIIEPLRIQPLRTGLIFIDGRDQSQIDYAIQRGKKQPLKIVLTAGSPLELRIKYQNAQWRTGTGIPFYFDQRKMIITNFKKLYGIVIDSVPATVYQRGDKLAIDFGMQP
jgi:conjugal transfer pilus assembly protein TraW